LVKRLFVVRSGECEYDNDRLLLSKHGKASITILAQKIAEKIKSGNVLIFRTSAFRAGECADIISKALGKRHNGDIITSNELWINKDIIGSNLSKSLNYLSRYLEQADTIIIVSHSIFAANFPSHFAEKVLKTKLSSYSIDNACAWAIDCNKKTISKIEPF